MIRLREELASALSALQDTARAIAEAQQEAGLAVDEEEYVESFAPFLMDVIHAWSRVRGSADAWGFVALKPPKKQWHDCLCW